MIKEYSFAKGSIDSSQSSLKKKKQKSKLPIYLDLGSYENSLSPMHNK